jgi:hypothetical protein
MQRDKGPRLWIEKRQGRDPVYVIRDGKTKRSTGLPPDRHEEARQELARYIAENYGPEPYKAQAAQISVAEVLAYYARTLQKAAERKNTPAVRRGTATRMIHIANLLTFWETKTLADVRTSVCEQYEEHRKAMPRRRGMRKGAEAVSSGTVRLELKTLGRAITAWHGESPLPALPVIWKPDAPKARERYLERHEAARLIRAARRLKFPHLVRYILIGIYTGTRDDAMRRLRWMRASQDGWIDTTRGILYRAGFAEDQTSKRRPPMVLPDLLLGHTRRWAARDAAAGLTHAITYRGQPVGDLYKSWASTVKAAGLDRDVTPHTLKHTAITWMLWAGRSIWEVSEDIGTSAKTIEEVYGHHRTVESRLARGRQSVAKLSRKA